MRFSDIRQWASDRNLIEGSTTDKQFLKLMEECGELAAGLARDKQDAVIDGIGDIVVVLTILAAQRGVKIEDCIEAAWDEIKDRKGRMIDGVFVKESDLTGWIKHNGVGSPVDAGTLVIVKLRNGTAGSKRGIPAEDWNWKHLDNDYDIVEYMVVENKEADL